MDLYFLDWVRTRYKTEPETHTKSAHTVLWPSGFASYELGPRCQLGWGSGLALAKWVGLGRVSQEAKKNNLRSKDDVWTVGLGRVSQEAKKNNLRSKDDVWTVVLSKSPRTANRRSQTPGEFLFRFHLTQRAYNPVVEMLLVTHSFNLLANDLMESPLG